MADERDKSESIDLQEAVARSMSEPESGKATVQVVKRERPAAGSERERGRARADEDSDAPRVYVVGVWRRAAAGLVDLACVSPVLLLAAWLALRVARLPIGERFGPETLIELLLWGGAGFYGTLALCIAIALLYALIFVALTGRTPGLRLLGARVINVYGERPEWWRVVLRCLAMMLSVALAGLGLLWIGFDREKRGLHDWIAGTYVIRARPAPRAAVARSTAPA
ncbi:MAG: RDD family protein [Myxococcales bacterium]|nr:RDD family protein [Myxococcales bacterium]